MYVYVQHTSKIRTHIHIYVCMKETAREICLLLSSFGEFCRRRHSQAKVRAVINICNSWCTKIS